MTEPALVFGSHMLGHAQEATRASAGSSRERVNLVAREAIVMLSARSCPAGAQSEVGERALPLTVGWFGWGVRYGGGLEGGVGVLVGC
uniref:Uncharacterized protein n=1 Tax=Knipowitschia caucasica TaxID=637954 RepID=A0AAV2JC20_KNICA